MSKNNASLDSNYVVCFAQNDMYQFVAKNKLEILSRGGRRIDVDSLRKIKKILICAGETQRKYRQFVLPMEGYLAKIQKIPSKGYIPRSEYRLRKGRAQVRQKLLC
jgi:hypothetical protein